MCESGYRKFRKPKYEILVDVGQLGPDYIPGHAHADIFNFVLYVDGLPFIVDQGTSTYENNSRRHFERSTSAHNTVSIADTNQSEMWGAFRVGRRARIIDHKETSTTITASHDAFIRKFGIEHRRSFEFANATIKIYDQLIGAQKAQARAYFHFAPGLKPKIKEDSVQIKESQSSFSKYYKPRCGRIRVSNGV